MGPKTMKDFNTFSDYQIFLEDRSKSFLSRLRSQGLDAPSASFLRSAVHRIGDSTLAIDSEGLPGDTDDESELTITRTITTPSLDRYGDSIQSRGCQKTLEKYLSNPQVFFAHKSTDLPIATTKDLQVFDTKIVAVAKFHEETEEARCIWRMRKLLPATSVGFLPVKASIIGSNKDEDEEIEERLKKRKEKTDDGEKVITFEPWFALRFLEWELLEWSVVSIPANPDCVESLSKILSDGVVEGEKVPLSISKALSNYTHKGKVWVHGFNPETEKHTGLVKIGGHELEFDGGKITKLDGSTVPTTNDPSNPVPVPNPANDNPPGMEVKPSVTSLSAPFKKYVKAGEQDPANPQLLAVPDKTQPNHFSCGLFATWEVGEFFGVGPDTYEGWNELLGTSIEQSTHPEKIVEVLSSLGLTVEARHGMSVDDLRQCWLAGSPVIVPVQDYADDVPTEADFDYGHYLVVIGCALGVVVCQDSSENNVTRGSGSIQDGGRIIVEETNWLKNWHDSDVDGNKFIQYGIICSGGIETPSKSLINKDTVPTGTPAPPGSNIQNLDSVHASIDGIHQSLKEMMKTMQVHCESTQAHVMQHKSVPELLTKIHTALIGQPDGDMDDDLKPGDPNYHDPNTPVKTIAVDPALSAILELVQQFKATSEEQSRLTKANSEALFSLTGKQS